MRETNAAAPARQLAAIAESQNQKPGWLIEPPGLFFAIRLKPQHSMLLLGNQAEEAEQLFNRTLLLTSIKWPSNRFLMTPGFNCCRTVRFDPLKPGKPLRIGSPGSDGVA